MKKADRKKETEEQIKLYQKETERVSQELNNSLSIAIKNYSLFS
jgi:hypothetical protein